MCFRRCTGLSDYERPAHMSIWPAQDGRGTGLLTQPWLSLNWEPPTAPRAPGPPTEQFGVSIKARRFEYPDAGAQVSRFFTTLCACLLTCVLALVRLLRA